MSHLPSILRPAAFAVATLFLAPTSFVTTTATVATVSAVTIMTTTQAEAGRARVQDHRRHPAQGGPYCRAGGPKCPKK
jgi:hypothetical protein